MLNLVDILNSQKGTSSRMNRIRVVCVGDSITGWNNEGTSDSWHFSVYPSYLERFLKQEVANFGIAGAMSALAPNLAKDALKYLPSSETYILGFGTNDLAASFDLSLTSSEILNNLHVAYELLVSNKKRVILLNIPPVNKLFFSPSVLDECLEQRKYFNQKIFDFSKKYGLTLVDIGGLSHDNFADALHPNESGARIIAKSVFNALKPYAN